MVKDIHLQIQEVQWSPNMINTTKTTPKHILVINCWKPKIKSWKKPEKMTLYIQKSNNLKGQWLLIRNNRGQKITKESFKVLKERKKKKKKKNAVNSEFYIQCNEVQFIFRLKKKKNPKLINRPTPQEMLKKFFRQMGKPNGRKIFREE